MDNTQIKNTMNLLMGETTVMDSYNLELIDDLIYNKINELKNILEKDDAYKQNLIKSILKSFKKVREKARNQTFNDEAYEVTAHLQISLYTLIKSLIKYMDCADTEINQLIESQDDWLISTGYELLIHNDSPPRNELIQRTFQIMRDNVQNASTHESLANWLNKDTRIFDEIIAKFDSENKYFQQGVLYSFYFVEKLTIEAEALVLRILQDTTSKIRSSAVLPAGKCFFLRNEAITLLLKETEDDKWYNRAHAVTALSVLKVVDEGIINRIANLLGDNRGDMDWSTEEAAIEALTRIGKPAKIILPKLLKLLYFQLNGEKYEKRILEICEAISKIDNGTEPVISALIKVVAQCEFVAQSAAIRALGNFGSKSKAVLPLLEKYVSEDDYIEGDYIDQDEPEIILLKNLYKIAGADSRLVKKYIGKLKLNRLKEVRETALSFEKSIYPN